MVAKKIEKNNQISDAIRFRHRDTCQDNKKNQRFAVLADFFKKPSMAIPVTGKLSLSFFLAGNRQDPKLPPEANPLCH
jgi:hypothetical protein